MSKNFKSQSGIAHILILLAAVGLIAFLLISNTANFKDKLFGALFPKPSSHAAAIRGQSGDLWADVVIGQPNFGELAPNETVSYKVNFTFGGGTVVDRSVSPGRLYVWDGGNSRILGIDLAKCYEKDNNTPCGADIVIGQPNANTSACNGDANFQKYTPGSPGALGLYRSPASASTLCGVRDDQQSITENITYSNMYVDSQGNLYVSDSQNNRVLKYNSPFTTDTVADEVWGQSNFSGNLCNGDPSLDPAQMRNSPTASSLCTWSAGGVGVDSSGNVWVADSFNNRVLRFPVGSKTADLVLGQKDFTSGGYWGGGNTLDKLASPAGIRIDNQGKVYIADSYNGRISVFEAPFSNGMMAKRILKDGLCPMGLELDPQGAGVWVNDDCGGHSRTLLLDFNGNVLKILGKDVITNNEECAGVLCNNAGSIGIDALGNVIISSGRYFNDVSVFEPPFPNPSPGNFYYPKRNLFSPPVGGYNLVSNKEFGQSGQGFAVTHDQLIAGDGRLLFWNNPSSLTDGKAADGEVQLGSNGWYYTSPESDGERLWVMVTQGDGAEFWVYQLPLTSNSQPTHKIRLPIPVLGGGQISNGSGIGGIEPQGDGKYLWVTQGGGGSNLHRVFRIKDPLTTSPVIDVILGQANATDAGCNRITTGNNYMPFYEETATNTVCFPGTIEADKLGNIWVSDYRVEAWGNWRLLEFNADLFNNIGDRALFGPNASKVIKGIHVTGLGFDSQGRALVSNGLFGHFYSVFDNLLAATSNTPDRVLNDYYSVAIGAEFDELDNLYTMDHNRARVLKYLNPFGVSGGGATPTPTVNPTALPTPTPISSPTSCRSFDNDLISCNNAGCAYWSCSNQCWPSGTSIEVACPWMASPSPTPTSTPTPIPSSTPIGAGDTTPPTVDITSPTNGAVVNRNSSVTLSATATDNIGVTKVEFRVGSTLVNTDTSAPYSYSYKLPGKPNAVYTITATAFDSANNSSSDVITIRTGR